MKKKESGLKSLCGMVLVSRRYPTCAPMAVEVIFVKYFKLCSSTET